MRWQQTKLTTETALPQRLLSLQVMRFVAAVLVVYAHAVDANLVAGGQPLVAGTALENLGAFGVDIFFVISGFIVTQTVRRAPSASVFWRDRILRIAPLYWLFSIPAAAFALSSEGFRPGELLTTVLFWPVWGQYTAPYLSVGWSLSFEMLFYLVMGLSLLRLDPRWLLGCYGLALVAQMVWPTPVLRFLGNPIIIEFLFGIAIALWGDRFARFARISLVSAIVWMMITLLFGNGAISEVEWTVSGALAIARVVLWGIPAALLVHGAVGLEVNCRGPVWVAVAALGDASYALYLTHRFVTLFGGKALEFLGFQFDFTVPLLAVSVLVGWLVHLRIELPLQKWLKRTRPRLSLAHWIRPGWRGSASA